MDLSLPSLPSIYLTAEGHHHLKKELDFLITGKRIELTERLRNIKHSGEFSEDHSELEDIKFEQALTEKRILELKKVLSTAHILESNQIPTSYVGIGSFVKVQDVDRGLEFEVRVVTSFEADPDKDIISNESPMGKALLKKKVGETVVFEAPAGKIHYTILEIHL